MLEGAYAVPLGADGLTLSGTAATLRTRAREADIRGRARLGGVSLSYPVIRREEQAADVSFGIDGVNSKNAAFGNVIASERTRAARLAGTFVHANETHNLTLTGTLSRGLDIFDARSGLGDVNFSKANATALYERTLVPRLLGRAHATLQFTGDLLPAAELFSVGGASVGRAFDTGFLTGDKGRGGFVELADRPIRAEDFSQSEIYAFADAADLTVKARDPFPSQKFDMASAGGGLRARYKNKIQLGIEGAAVLNRPFPAYTKDRRLSFFRCHCRRAPGGAPTPTAGTRPDGITVPRDGRAGQSRGARQASRAQPRSSRSAPARRSRLCRDLEPRRARARDPVDRARGAARVQRRQGTAPAALDRTGRAS